MAKKKSNPKSKRASKSKKRRVNTRKATRASAKTKRRRITPKKRVTRKNPQKRKPLKKSSKKVEYSIISQDGGHYENWYGRVREYLPVKRITDDNADFYIRKVMLDLPEVRNSISFTMFWEISSVTQDDEGEIIDERISAINVTASSHEDLIRGFRFHLFKRLNEYKAKIYLRKTWAYATNQTRHPRTKYTKLRPGEKAKVSKKKKRRGSRA